MHNPQRWMPAVLLCACLSACQSADFSKTGAVVPYTIAPATFNPTPSLTASPSAAATEAILPGTTPTFRPTAGALPELHTAGPYLRLHPAYSSDPIPQVLFDLDGSGREVIQIPESEYGSLSPDAHRFARLVFEADERVALEILDLWNGETKKIADLLPADYPERQERMVEEYKAEVQSRPDSQEFMYLEFINLESAVSGLLEALDNLAWSPDGRYLAFPAMIDGDSSDVYLLDVDTGRIQRKDDEYLNVFEIGWSPDGQWILFSNVLPLSVDPILTTTSWSVRVDSPSTVRLAEACDRRWISDTEFLYEPCAHGCGGTDFSTLYRMNVQTGGVSQIWRGIFYDYAVDRGNGTILIVSEDPCEPDECEPVNPGFFLGPLYGKKNRIGDLPTGTDGYSVSVVFRGGTADRFLINTYDSLSGVTAGGMIELIFSGDTWGVEISPNRRWLAVFGLHGIALFDERDELVYTWETERVSSASWKTNSQGVFFQSEGEIHYLQVAPPSAEHILDCTAEHCGSDTWISFFPHIRLDSLPNIRARPPTIEKQTTGTSLWTKAIFRDLLEPGAQEYSVALPAYSEWRWDFSWCGADEENLSAILDPFTIRFLVGGEEIGEDIFRIYDTAKGGGFCRTWATLLSGWQPEDATDLEIRYTLGEAVNDGMRVYPPGEYRQIIHVTVTG